MIVATSVTQHWVSFLRDHEHMMLVQLRRYYARQRHLRKSSDVLTDLFVEDFRVDDGSTRTARIVLAHLTERRARGEGVRVDLAEPRDVLVPDGHHQVEIVIRHVARIPQLLEEFTFTTRLPIILVDHESLVFGCNSERVGAVRIRAYAGNMLAGNHLLDDVLVVDFLKVVSIRLVILKVLFRFELDHATYFIKQQQIRIVTTVQHVADDGCVVEARELQLGQLD